MCGIEMIALNAKVTPVAQLNWGGGGSLKKWVSRRLRSIVFRWAQSIFLFDVGALTFRERPLFPFRL